MNDKNDLSIEERLYFLEQREHIRELVCDYSVAVDDRDNSVCEALARVRPTYFANGGDRKTNNTPEMELCEQLGIGLLWNVGGGKIQSSSDLVSDAGMVIETPEDSDLRPTRVEVIQGSELPKSGDY